MFHVGEIFLPYTFWLIISTVILILFVLFYLKSNKKYPPGPKGYPIIGNAFVFRCGNIQVKIPNLTKQYKGVYRLSVFGQNIIILGNYEVMKEAFINQGTIFSGTPQNIYMFKYWHKDKGIAYSDIEVWKEQKKFAMSHLLRSGFQESYDKIILEEIELAFNEIQRKNGKCFDPKQLFVQMGINIVMRMTASERIDYHTNDDFIQNNMHGIVSSLRMSNPVNFFPILKYILKSHKKYKECIQNINDYLMNIVKKHENSFDENNLRDYIDAFLFKMYEEEKKENTSTSFTREQLIGSLKDFLLAGSETSAFTLLFAILFLLHHPHIQTQVQNEINDVIGSSRNPQMSDCAKLPFTHATILETQRLSNVIPLAVPKIAKENIKIKEYDIPKGGYVIGLLYAVHLDPKYWKNPSKFDPNRFLDKNGEIIKNIKSFWPFSTGQRQCMGEALAKSELFLIFTSMLQRYTFKSLSNDLSDIMSDCIEGAALSPLPFEVSFILK